MRERIVPASSDDSGDPDGIGETSERYFTASSETKDLDVGEIKERGIVQSILARDRERGGITARQGSRGENRGILDKEEIMIASRSVH